LQKKLDLRLAVNAKSDETTQVVDVTGTRRNVWKLE